MPSWFQSCIIGGLSNANVLQHRLGVAALCLHCTLESRSYSTIFRNIAAYYGLQLCIVIPCSQSISIPWLSDSLRDISQLSTWTLLTQTCLSVQAWVAFRCSNCSAHAFTLNNTAGLAYAMAEVNLDSSGKFGEQLQLSSSSHC